MALLGWSPVEGMAEIFTLEEAARAFGFERVNKAGAKFDWDKLNWLNSQYIQKMPPTQLMDLLITYWQGAGYEFDWTGNRSWLEQVSALMATDLIRLEEIASKTRYLFVDDVGFTEDARKKLQQDGSTAIVEAIAAAISNVQPLTEGSASELIKQVALQLGRKEGQLKPILRVALTGDTRGPDLIQSWLLLHQRGWDVTRLQRALEIAKE
jgi:glutamyl-tRNA synthetase